MKILAKDRHGNEHTVDGNAGWTLMEILRDANLGIHGDCGGSSACATCHVYVADGWIDKLEKSDESEIEMLNGTAAPLPNSRLSCQIRLASELDGIEVTVAPE